MMQCPARPTGMTITPDALWRLYLCDSVGRPSRARAGHVAERRVDDDLRTHGQVEDMQADPIPAGYGHGIHVGGGRPQVRRGA